MDKDTIIIKGQEEALSFYIEALSAGICVDWEGVCPSLTWNDERYFKIIVDKKRTFEKGG